MKNHNNTILVITILIIAIIYLFYKVIDYQLGGIGWSGTSIAICSSLGLFILSIIISLIRKYKQ